MGKTYKLAVPSLGEGGLDAERSGHFGQCDCFTIVDIVDGKLTEVSILDNPPHESGGCLRPVQLLADQGVDAIIAAGMGGRPLAGFNEANITVLFENQTPNVGKAATLAAEGDLPVMSLDQACNHHH